jgi:hypothetical protein
MPQESQRRPPCSTESKGSPNGDGPCSTATGTEPVLLPAGQLFSQRLSRKQRSRDGDGPYSSPATGKLRNRDGPYSSSPMPPAIDFPD